MLNGKAAVVTGSTSGIGLAIARALAQAGARVALNGFGDAAEIEKLRAGIEKEFKVKAAYLAADMTKPAEIAGMIKTAEQQLGSVDILVANAGIQHVAAIEEFPVEKGDANIAINLSSDFHVIRTAEQQLGSVDILVANAGIQHVAAIEEFPVEKWDAIIAINLSSAFHAIRAAVPGMKAKKWGRIVCTASAHSLVASPFKAAYITAKHGLAGLTKTVALEVAQFGITANCVSPGYVWTPLVERQIPDTMKARKLTKEQVINDVLLAAQPTKQFVAPEQVASLDQW